MDRPLPKTLPTRHTPRPITMNALALVATIWTIRRTCIALANMLHDIATHRNQRWTP